MDTLLMVGKTGDGDGLMLNGCDSRFYIDISVQLQTWNTAYLLYTGQVFFTQPYLTIFNVKCRNMYRTGIMQLPTFSTTMFHLVTIHFTQGETNFQPREFPRSGSKAKDVKEEEERKKSNTLGTAGGPGGRD